MIIHINQSHQGDGRRMYLYRSQVIILIVAVACNASFIPVFQKWVRYHEWGANAFIIPDVSVSIAGFDIMTYSIVSAHVVLSFVLLVLILLQIFWVHIAGPGHKLHRFVGIFTIFIVGAVFFAVSILATVYVLKTPFNRAMYFVLPVLIAYELLRGYASARRRDIRQHADAIFVAMIVLNSAPIYRMVLAVIYAFGGHEIITPEHNPIDGGGFMTYLVLIAFILAPKLFAGKSYRLSATPVALASVLILSMLFLPYSFFDAPELTRFGGQ